MQNLATYHLSCNSSGLNHSDRPPASPHSFLAHYHNPTHGRVEIKRLNRDPLCMLLQVTKVHIRGGRQDVPHLLQFLKGHVAYARRGLQQVKDVKRASSGHL